MQYLIQVVEEGSKAERLVQSFSATASNYPKAIQQLQERFGRDDLLVQIYVRDLLSMVMKNATTGRMKISLPILYDELEGKLRALESLGKTQEKYGDFLTPLVESCLPEEVLIAWERSRTNESETKNSRSLSDLMAFLHGEVRSEEMILPARSGFEDKQCGKKEISIVSEKQTGSPTAAALVSLSSSGKRNSNCIFCNGRHPGFKCFDARKMTRQERLHILLKKGACFTCLYKSGHISKFCDKKSRIKCKLCSDPHYEIMCKRYNSKNVQNNMDVGDHSSNSEVALSNAGIGRHTVYLQTLEVVIRGQGREKRIRLVFDSGSMSSHISDRIIKQLGLKPHRVETIINTLFGGSETSPREKGLYAIEIKTLNESFSVCLEALSEEKICGFVPKINDRMILRELKNRKMEITDSVSGEYEIDLLIGADLLGSLLTGEIVELDGGLTAVHTKLGWTIMG
ncbi:hypothetical protein AVEN_71424-1, partial [Araneus ventricosus]